MTDIPSKHEGRPPYLMEELQQLHINGNSYSVRRIAGQSRAEILRLVQLLPCIRCDRPREEHAPGKVCGVWHPKGFSDSLPAAIHETKALQPADLIHTGLSRESLAGPQAASPHEIGARLRPVPDDPIAKALTELVRLKAIKDRWDAIPLTVPLTAPQLAQHEADERAYLSDYKKNVGPAWEAARAALKSVAEPDLTQKYQRAIWFLQDIAAMGKKEGSETAAHALAQLGERRRGEPELDPDSPEVQFADVLKELEAGRPINPLDAINALQWKVQNQRRTLARLARKSEGEPNG